MDFFYYKGKNIPGDFAIEIYTLHFTGLMWVNILMSVNTWEFYPPPSCTVLTLAVVRLSGFPSRWIRSQVRYWKIPSGSSMKLSWSLWLTLMILEFIVGDGRNLLKSGWICSSNSSVIMFSFVSSKNYSCSIS